MSLNKTFIRKRKRPKYLKYAYNIDDVVVGQIVPIICHKRGCDRFIFAKVLNPSTMELRTVKSNDYFDMRNQVYYCKQHNN